jgi:hypothetical protein
MTRFLKATDLSDDMMELRVGRKTYLLVKAGKNAKGIVVGYGLVMGESGNPQKPIRYERVWLGNFFHEIHEGTWARDKTIYIHPVDWRKLQKLNQRSLGLIQGGKQ